MNDSDRRPGGAVLWAVLAAIVIAIVALILFGRKGDGSDDAASGAKAVPVRTVLIEARDIADTVTLPARVEPDADVVLAAEKAGSVLDLPADKGDRVKAGQVVLKLDDSMWRNAFLRAETLYREAEKDFKRWQELKKTGSVSDHEFDAVARARDLARIAFDQAKTDLGKCEVRAPVDGTVEDRYVERGEYVHEGGPVMRVVNIDSVKLALDVPERDILSIGTGTEVGFSLSALPGRQFTGKVSFVSAVADEQSNSFRVEVRADNPDHAARGGMIAEVVLERGVREDAVVLPLAAVVNHRGEHVVFVAKAGKAERRVVVIEPISSHHAVITSGLAPGEVIVVEGHRSLEDGLSLEVVE